MKSERYLQHIKRKYFQKQYAMYTKVGYIFPAIPEGFEVVDTEEAREWERESIKRMNENAIAYYKKNTTRFD
jgi:hypothetical protein